MTGVVRAAVENMWNDLKRGHYIDSMTRLVTITLQLKSNHVGVRYRITLMLELTSLGAILPSYDVETRILDERAINDMMLCVPLACLRPHMAYCTLRCFLLSALVLDRHHEPSPCDHEPSPRGSC